MAASQGFPLWYSQSTRTKASCSNGWKRYSAPSETVHGGLVPGAPLIEAWPEIALPLATNGWPLAETIGESDEKAAYPKTRPVSPQDLMATLFQVLGIDQKLQYTHPSGRPISMIQDGSPIEELF